MMKKPTLSIIAAILSVLFVQATEETETMKKQEHVQVADLTPVTLLPVKDHEPVSLVAKGEGQAVIYVAEESRTDRLDQLLTELVEVIRLRTGAELEVVESAPALDQPAIIIGQSGETRELVDTDALPVEGFQVLTASNRVYLLGSTAEMPYPKEVRVGGTHPYANHGTAWAVADFMERFVGVRWYWPLDVGGRSVLKSDSLIVPPSHYSDAPVFAMRTHHPPTGYRAPFKSRWFDGGHVPVEFQDKIPPANTKDGEIPSPVFPIPEGLEVLDMKGLLSFLRADNSWPYQIRVHEPQRYRHRGDEWMEEHKDLFALQEDGSINPRVFCYSSPATLEFLLQGCEEVWDKGGQASWVTPNSVTLSPADVAVTCHCAECQKLWVEGNWQGRASRIMGNFLEKFAAEVKRRWPDKKVVYLPYWNYTLYPEGSEFPKNLEVMVANNFPQGPADFRMENVRKAADDLLREWSSATGSGKVTTWEYSLSVTGWTHAPVQFPNLLRDYYQDNRKVIAGSFLNGGVPAEWSRNAPTLYYWMKLLWNPEIESKAVFDEMCARMFGEGAGPARALLQLMIERFEKAEWPTRMGDAGQVSDAIFAAIWPPEVIAQMQTLRAEAEKRLPKGSLERQRLDYWLWAFDAFVAEANLRQKTSKKEKQDS